MMDDGHKAIAKNMLQGHVKGYEEGFDAGLKWLAAALVSQGAVRAANEALYGSATGGVRKALEAALEAAMGELR